MSEVWDDFSIVVTTDADDATILVAGELDLASAPQLQRAFDDRLERQVTVDLAGVTFIDSTGLRALVTARNDLAERNQQLVVGRCSPAAARVFALTGLGDALGVTGAAPA